MKTFTRLVPPPSRAPTEGQPAGSVDLLVFANTLDGYAVERVPATATDTTVYATTNGARTWQRVSFGRDASVSNLVAASNRFYGIVARCSPTCTHYRLAHAAAGSTSWSETDIPNTGQGDDQSFGLSAAGTTVWLTLQDQSRGDETVLLRSTDGVGPFAVRPEPELGSVAACGLSADAGAILWVECPTGMMVAYLHSTDGGRRFRQIWDFSGTGGALFDPVTGAIAYRYTGIGTTSPRLRPDRLQRTTNGGAAFKTVGPFPRHFGPQQLCFVNKRDGFALGTSGSGVHTGSQLLRTNDGGRTWTRASF